jgi:hypothetical protein
MFLYLLAIPSFAAIYAFLIPSHFYHSTVQFESVLNKDANTLLTEIKKSIVHEFKIAHSGTTTSDGKWQIDISKIGINSLRSESDRTWFTLSMQLNGINEYEGIESGFFLQCSIENRVQYATAISPYYDMVIYKQPDCEPKANLPIDLKVLFPAKYNGSDHPYLLLPINQNVQDTITHLQNAMRGFPSKVSGVYARMFYFSAVTITTLGYGDIVPVTNTARNIVAAESIIGIILIGMFLNSLSNENKNA